MSFWVVQPRTARQTIEALFGTKLFDAAPGRVAGALQRARRGQGGPAGCRQGGRTRNVSGSEEFRPAFKQLAEPE